MPGQNTRGRWHLLFHAELCSGMKNHFHLGTLSLERNHTSIRFATRRAKPTVFLILFSDSDFPSEPLLIAFLTLRHRFSLNRFSDKSLRLQIECETFVPLKSCLCCQFSHLYNRYGNLSVHMARDVRKVSSLDTELTVIHCYAFFLDDNVCQSTEIPFLCSQRNRHDVSLGVQSGRQSIYKVSIGWASDWSYSPVFLLSLYHQHRVWLCIYFHSTMLFVVTQFVLGAFVQTERH